MPFFSRKSKKKAEEAKNDEKVMESNNDRHPSTSTSATASTTTNSPYHFSKKANSVPSSPRLNIDVDEELEIEYNKEINRFLKEQNAITHTTFRIIFTGPGETGKTTLMKQISKIHKGEIGQDIRMAYIDVIRENVQEYLMTLCRENKALITAGIKQCALKDQKMEEIRDRYLERSIPVDFDSELVLHMELLWNDKGIRETLLYRARYQLPDNAEHFLDRVKEIANPSYIPSFNDYIQVRIRTTGYAEEIFFTRTHDTEVRFQFIDVGGQRSERRKWMKYVKEDVDCVVFVVGISDFDLSCFEDNETKRLDEALTMFEELAKQQFFDRKTLVIFFNKFDIFEEKLAKISFKVAFPEIREEEAHDAKLICKFLKQKFLDIVESTKVKLLSPPHFFSTRALSTKNVHKVIRSIQTDLVRQKLLSQSTSGN